MGDFLASILILGFASSASSVCAGSMKLMNDKKVAHTSAPAKKNTPKPSSKTTSKPSTKTSAPAKQSASKPNAQTSSAGGSSSSGWPSWSSKITASVDTRVSEMRDILQNGMAAGKRTTKQMTGSDGRIYFVVPNGLEDEQLAWLQELTTFAKKLYSSALKRHGSDDVYTARLGTFVQDTKVSYIHCNSYYAGDSPYTSVYPSGKRPPSGMLSYPYMCMNGYWETVDRRGVGTALMPKDADWKAKVMPYALHLFMHELAHGMGGSIGHNEYWLKAWNWCMHEAEAAGLWSHAELLKTLNGTILSKDTFRMDPNAYYTFDPYTDADLAKCISYIGKFGENGQQQNLYDFNPYYKPGLGCPCS